MSGSPERMSSYRRHFEGTIATSSSALQVRLASPSPTRRSSRTRSASYNRSAGAMGHRALSASRKAQMSSYGGSMGALCMSMGGMDLETASAENQAFLSTRTTERQEMVTLNDRLAKYIEKVRSLESQNKLLEAEIDALQNRYTKPSGLRKLYEDQLREMLRVADQMRAQRDLAVAAKDAMAGQLEMVKVKYEEAVEMRKKVEMDIEAFRPDVDAATAARIALEKQLDNLEREVEFLQRVHKQEIEELMAQIYNSVASVGVAFELPDLSAAVKDIQAQYDSIAAKNLQEMDSWYKNKFKDMNQATTRHAESVRSVREGITSVKRDIQSKERELESLKTRNDALEAQIREAQERYRKEEEEMLARIEAVKEELKSIKTKIAIMLKEYQELLNIKMALEIEITTYRKLIEGEDCRLNTMVRGMSSLMGRAMGGSSIGIMAAGAMGSSVMRDSTMGMSKGIGMVNGSASDKSASLGAGAMATESMGLATSGGGSAMSTSKMSTSSMSSSSSVTGGFSGSGLIEEAGALEMVSNGTDGMMMGSSDVSKTIASANGVMSMSASSTMEFSEEQAVEMTERKTLLIS